MPSVPFAFLFFALVILLGFLASRVFQTTKVPDIPLLLSLGLIVGPLNRVWFQNEFLEEGFNVVTLKAVAPYLSTLALIVILFDSGIKLDFAHFGRSMRPAFLHTVPLLFLTVGVVASVAHLVLGMPILVSVVLGVALSNVGQTVSAALIREINMKPETRSIYFAEMAIYDLISIPVLVGLLEFAKGTQGVEDFGLFFQALARALSISLVIGVAGGIVWIQVLSRLENYPYTYMVTLATLLLVYSLNSLLGGSGPVAVLVFGIVVGNRAGILKVIGKKFTFKEEGERVHSFHDEITFFVRSFFFVFLGITFSTGAGEGLRTDLPRWNVASEFWPFSVWNETATLFLIGMLLVFTLMVSSRYVVVRFVSARGHPDRMALFSVYGRGLGTAVLATFPFTLAEYQDTASLYYRLFSPFESLFTNSALLIILLTVLGTSVTVMWQEQRAASQARAGSAKRELASAKE